MQPIAEFQLATPSPIFEHLTSSLVFSDPPLHARVRRILMDALNQRAITPMEAGVAALVNGRVAIGALVQRLPKLQLAGAPERDRHVRFRGLRLLPVTLG